MSDEKATPDSFDEWAVVEIMGHDRYAGRVTEQVIAGAAMLRVDVPAVTRDDKLVISNERPLVREAFTKFFGGGAIFSITPCSETVARAAANRFCKQPMSVYAPDYQHALSYQDEDDEL